MALAAVVMAAACTVEDPVSKLAGIDYSNDYITLASANGASSSITVTADQDWTATTTASWLSITPASGVAGQEATITFSTTEEAKAERTAEVNITFGSKTKIIIVKQAAPEGVEAEPSTCKQIMEGPDVTYRVTGVITKISNTHYGNWYINDGTVDGDGVYVYGTLDKKGGANSSSNSWDNINDASYANSWELSVGDIVTIEGPKTVYNGTVELVDVTIVKVEKSLLKVETPIISAGKEGGEFEASIVSMGDNLDVKADQDWIHISNIRTENDTTVVTFFIHENVDDARTGTVTFSTSSKGQTYTGTLPVEQATGIKGYQLPFEELFASSIGSFSINDIVPVSGKTIWTQATYNGSGYMKATSGGKVDCESDLVSPNIDLTAATTATLTFEHTHKYAGNVYEELTLWASIDGGATWQQLLIPAYGTNNDWTFVPVTISLNKFVGNIVNLAWKYKSNTSAYATWEVAKVKVTADNAALTCVADIDNAIASSSDVEFSATLKDAVVTYVNGNNAFIEDATGGIQLYMKSHGLKAGQTINGEISGKAKVYAGYTEMTSIDITKATVADGTAPAGTELTLDKLLKSYLRYQNCKVVLKDIDVTTGIAKDARDGKVAQNGAEVALRAQVNGVTMAAGKGTLVCWPTQYNGKLQLGAWEDAHFTN